MEEKKRKGGKGKESGENNLYIDKTSGRKVEEMEREIRLRRAFVEVRKERWKAALERLEGWRNDCGGKVGYRKEKRRSWREK